MREFSLKKTPDIVVEARFIEKGRDMPLNQADLMIRLYDKDYAGDDFLGQCRPDINGRIEISFSHDSFVNDLVFNEAKPDFYFTIFKGDKAVYTTNVLNDIKLEDVQQFRMGKGEIVNLGTFLVPTMADY